MKPTKKLRSDIAWSTHDQIGVLGYDLCRDLIGKVSLGDMGFLEITGRLPKKHESDMFNALLVTLVEHGIVPSTLATRMTYTGAPEGSVATFGITRESPLGGPRYTANPNTLWISRV